MKTYPPNNDAVYALRNDSFFDRKTITAVLEQIDHLNFKERIIVACAQMSLKIAQMHYHDGVLTYFTDVHSNRDGLFNFSSMEFRDIRQGVARRNVPYHGVFLTLMDIYDGDTLFIEHNSKFENEEYLAICKAIAQLNNVAKDQDREYRELINRIGNRIK